MSYVNADGVLPEYLLTEIQKYVDGQMLYIPRRQENAFAWGQKSGAKEKMADRNRQILREYRAGATVSELSREYYLSEKRVQGIIRDYGSSAEGKETEGGIKSE